MAPADAHPDPDGLTRRVFVRSRPIPWERIAEAVTVQGAWLTLAPGVRISTVGLRVDPAYAGRTIDRFRNDPDARAAMGGTNEGTSPVGEGRARPVG